MEMFIRENFVVYIDGHLPSPVDVMLYESMEETTQGSNTVIWEGNCSDDCQGIGLYTSCYVNPGDDEWKWKRSTNNAGRCGKMKVAGEWWWSLPPSMPWDYCWDLVTFYNQTVFLPRHLIWNGVHRWWRNCCCHLNYEITTFPPPSFASIVSNIKYGWWRQQNRNKENSLII